MNALAAWLGATMLALGTLAWPAAAPAYRSWGVYYGGSAPEGALRAPDVLVLEPGHDWPVASLRRPGQKVLAYLSLGEVHRTRPYFATLAATPGTLLAANPNWPDAVRVDPRAPAWRHVVLDEVAPALLARGYDGFFLDTVDVAAWLEHEQHLPGAIAAMAALVRDLRARAPRAMLVTNGGLALLPGLTGVLDALAAESVFTAYRFDAHRYAWRDDADAAARADALAAASARYHLPVFVLEYVDPTDAAGRAEAARRLRARGFVPFVADIGLASLAPTP